MTVDITDSLAPASDQLDAIELVASPRTFVIEKVTAGSPDQPVQVHLANFPRVWRPSKGMRRALAAGWGVDASTWTGRRVTLYYDPDVTFGKDRTGGTRIAAMSDLPGNKPLSVPLLITRGKSAMFTVQPLKDEPAPPATAGVTDRQLRELAASLRAANITDRAATLAYVKSVIDRDVASSKELTEAEAAEVLADLARLITESSEPDADTLPQMETDK